MIKDGIVYCDPPIQANLYEFMFSHLDCNCAIKNDYDSADNVTIVAFSSAEKFNRALKNKFKGNHSIEIVHSVGSSEVDCI